MLDEIRGKLNGDLTAAIALAQRGRINLPQETATIERGRQALKKRGGPYTPAEARVIESAERLTIYTPEREGSPDPKEWIERFVRATTDFHQHRLVQDAALRTFGAAQHRWLMGVGGARGAAAMREAELEYEQARAAVDHAGQVINRLNAERANRRHAEALARHATKTFDPRAR